MFPFVQYVLSCRCSVQQYVRWISCLLGRSWHHQRRCLSHLSRKSSHHRHNSLTAIYQKSYSARLHHNGVESSPTEIERFFSVVFVTGDIYSNDRFVWIFQRFEDDASSGCHYFGPMGWCVDLLHCFFLHQPFLNII